MNIIFAHVLVKWYFNVESMGYQEVLGNVN
jgi:hypothetical protein